MSDSSSLEEKIEAKIDAWVLQDPDAELSEHNESIVRDLIENLDPSIPDEGAESKNKKAKLSHGSKVDVKAPETSRDLAMYTVKHCKDEDLKGIFIDTKERTVVRGEDYSETRDDFVKAIETLDIVFFTFRGVQYGRERDKIQDDYKTIRGLLIPKEKVKGALDELFGCKKEDHIANLVSGGSSTQVRFQPDLSKSHAYVVTGESGSGKTWFTTQSLRRQKNLAKASFIYKEIGDEDAEKFKDLRKCQRDHKGSIYHAVLMAMCALCYNGHSIYSIIGEMSRKHNSKRNTSAKDCLEHLIQSALKDSEVASEWWKNPTFRLDQLVIIIDEVGKLPDLGRGLVDEVRVISKAYQKEYAQKVILVLVGSGLDGLIQQDSIPIHLLDTGKRSADSEDFEQSLLFFGTDPLKSQLITLKSPDLRNKDKIAGVPVSAIQRGTYSRVLATNTRMLLRGIIPIMTNDFNTKNVCPNEMTNRQTELGSTNIVMDYAARNYISLNGLSRLSAKPEMLKLVLLKQFTLLWMAGFSTNLIESNPAMNEAFTEANKMVKISDYETSLRLGIVTADITSTSAALRYLACEGSTAPLDATDGIGFETVLQHHLYRISRARHDLLASDDIKSGYFCGRYSLEQARPPSSTKRIKSPETKQSLEQEVQERMKAPKGRIGDAQKIAELVNGCNEYDVVLRQTVTNAQGADVMVLSKRQGNKAFLDLYQAKHHMKIPGPKTKKVVEAFASLGVMYGKKANSPAQDKKANDPFNTDPTIGSAGYSNVGTNMFVKQLEAALDCDVEVRNRVVVYSAAWDSASTNWREDFPFEEAKAKGLWVWTKELLEPTISALRISKQSYEEEHSDDGGESDDDFAC